MKRRDFLRNMSLAAAGFSLNGMPVRLMSRSLMTSSFTCNDVNDRILVLIQLHGGNDGLNTLIPIDQHPVYKNLRPVIGIEDTGPRKFIELDSTLPIPQQIGLHPDMTAIKDLYDSGRANMVMNVSYGNINGSHFKGTDIWLSGRDADATPEQLESGWWGRYLDHRFPNYPGDFPNTDMPDPPGLEFGSHIISLGFHREVGIPMGVTLSNDPADFASSLAGGALPTTFPNSDYGDELKFLVELEKSTNVYADRLANVYNAGTNAASVTYPETYHTATNFGYYNRLTPQLKTVARLISGGCKTKIYLVRLTGFDTHANQAVANKPSFGNHSVLLYHLSGAVKAFLDDLQAQGHADRVICATFSEFGRQVAENSTYGTDHGTAAPMLLFGKGITPGVTGTNPDLNNLQSNKLVGYEHDYRQVFTTLLMDWFGANPGTLDEVEFRQFENQKLDLIDSQHQDPGGQVVNYVADPTCDPTPYTATTTDDPVALNQSFRAWPVPAQTELNLCYKSEELMPAGIMLMTLEGKVVKAETVAVYNGENEWKIDVSGLKSGMYILQLVSNPGSGFEQNRLASTKVMIRN